MSFSFNFPAPCESTENETTDLNFNEKFPEKPLPAPASSHPLEITDSFYNQNSESVVSFQEHMFHLVDPTSRVVLGESESKISEDLTGDLNGDPNGNPEKDPLPTSIWNAISVGDTTLNFVCPEWLESEMESQKVSTNLSAVFKDRTNLDIIPRIYEGGLRVWDGACDMLSFLSSESPANLCGKKILELGCGAGLPGIYALLNGATVHFHDYNSEVIDLATIPNIRKNLQLNKETKSSQITQDKIRLYSGDWIEFVRFFDLNSQNSEENREDSRYDIILTSDTVYRKDVLEKLSCVLPKLLRKNGFVFVAGKSHYFGLDGGTDEFREELKKQNLLQIVSAKEFPDCVRREVLTVTWKN